jgi:hypothetical protein
VSDDEAVRGGYWQRFSQEWLLGRQLVDIDQWPLKPKRQQTRERDNQGTVANTRELQATLDRLDWSVQWHTLAELQAKRWYTAIKTVQIAAAAAIPVLTATGGGSVATRYLIAVLGAFIVVLEGIQQLKKYAQNALLWAQGKEALKHEYYLFHAQAGPYAVDDGQRNKLLATRIEQIIGQEVGRWAASREDTTVPPSLGGGKADPSLADGGTDPHTAPADAPRARTRRRNGGAPDGHHGGQQVISDAD